MVIFNLDFKIWENNTFCNYLEKKQQICHYPQNFKNKYIL